MFKLFYNDIKIIEKLLPKSLDLNSYLKFCGLEFSNVGTNSKFIFEKENVYIREIGISFIGEAVILRLYLHGSEHQNAYILLKYINDELIDSSLFINYDCIYLENKEDYLYWLGKEGLSKGIMNSRTFIIDEEPLERIGGILCKIALNFSGTLVYADKCIFQEEDSHVSTDLLDKLAELSQKDYFEIKQIFQEKLEDENWFLDIQKEEELTSFYYTFLEEELKIEYYKVRKEEMNEYIEKIYTVDKSGKKIYDRLIKRKTSFYSRAIEDEFFDEEYISLNKEKCDNFDKIVIDLGIPLKLNDILIGEEVIRGANRDNNKS